tara:strand:- start:255 stop:455 length:201 start_codon:yes stop_codon:yes gene_type:complete
MEKENYRTGEVTQLRRIADSLHELLQLVKEDQEQYKKKPEKNGRVESWDEKPKSKIEESLIKQNYK